MQFERCYCACRLVRGSYSWFLCRTLPTDAEPAATVSNELSCLELKSCIFTVPTQQRGHDVPCGIQVTSLEEPSYCFPWSDWKYWKQSVGEYIEPLRQLIVSCKFQSPSNQPFWLACLSPCISSQLEQLAASERPFSSFLSFYFERVLWVRRHEVLVSHLPCRETKKDF